MKKLSAVSLLLCLMLGCAQADESPSPAPNPTESIKRLDEALAVGDVVFIHVAPLPFRKVSEATQSWVNHVGIVTDVSGAEPVIAESAFPFSRTTVLSRFVARSKGGRVAVARLGQGLSETQRQALVRASERRMGILYDTGFNLKSRREFCSRFVREVLIDATGIAVGEPESFRTLLARNPDTRLGFWRVWYFGNIPWDRQTVTPASLYHSDKLQRVFDGFAS
ncbi:YebB family permuted papain-like enzyme [Niveibacterium terrae]|uniref:YebB family permuted papain-like enzyme n=1 Tax=Niveibacterium terrae TaxID=3373598 RepID=UPI003A94FCC3